MPLKAQAGGLSYGMLLLITCGVGFLTFFGSYMRIPIVPLYAGSLGADALQVGIINGSFLFVTGILSLPMGLLSDRTGRKLLILWGLVISIVTAFLLYTCRTPGQLMLVYLFFGIGQAAFAPTMMSYVADFSPPTHIGRTYGWYTLAIYVGMSTGPASGGLVAHRMGYPAVFLCSGGVLLLVLAGTLFFLPRARTITLRRAPRLPFKEAAGEVLRSPGLLACWLVTLGACMGTGTFITFVPLHASELGINVGQIGLIFAAQALSNAFSRIPFGYLGDRISNRSHLVVGGLMGFALCMACLGMVTHISAFLAVAAGLGFCMGIGFTAIGALMTELVSPGCRGLAMGGYNSAIYLGMMLGSLLMGAVVKEIGFKNGFLLIGLVNVLMTGGFHVIFRRILPGSTSLQNRSH